MQALSLGAALVISLFFIGFNVHVLCFVLLLLLSCLVFAICRAGADGALVPRSLLAAGLVALPLWFAISLFWNPVPSIGHVTFWWAITWSLVFWVLVLHPLREQIWPRAMLFVLLAGVGLAIYGVCQRFVLDDVPSGPFLDRNIYAALLAIIAFPAAGRFLYNGSDKRIAALLAIAFFLLSFAIALTQSRSGMLTFALAGLVFVIIAWTPGRAAKISVLVATAAAAFIAANLAWSGELLNKLATLENPNEAGHARYLIWEGTWRMILERPWTGIGLGMYPLMWPRYRHVEDSSAGYFVHNDYLQVWVDAGLPALLLFVGVLAIAGHMLFRQSRATARSDERRTELAGLAAAIALLPANSFFNYNFYVVPSLIVFGMLLARLQMFASIDASARAFAPVPSSSRRAWYVFVGLVALFPAAYFVSVAAASIVTDRAVANAGEGKYQAAEAGLSLARRLWPSAESILMLNADVYRHLLSASQSTDMKQREDVFRAAVAMLDGAERLNPFRPDIFLIRADLRRANRTFVAGDWPSAVEQDYRRAVELDPWHFRARYQFASFLLEQGATEKARALLEAGVSRSFALGHETIVPYLLLTAKLRQQAGDKEGADALVAHAKAVSESVRLERQRMERAPSFGWHPQP